MFREKNATHNKAFASSRNKKRKTVNSTDITLKMINLSTRKNRSLHHCIVCRIVFTKKYFRHYTHWCMFIHRTFSQYYDALSLLIWLICKLYVRTSYGDASPSKVVQKKMESTIKWLVTFSLWYLRATYNTPCPRGSWET